MNRHVFGEANGQHQLLENLCRYASPLIYYEADPKKFVRENALASWKQNRGSMDINDVHNIQSMILLDYVT